MQKARQRVVYRCSPMNAVTSHKICLAISMTVVDAWQARVLPVSRRCVVVVIGQYRIDSHHPLG